MNLQAQTWARARTGVPLLVMVDQEGGNVARLKVGTSLPSALALGETGDPNLDSGRTAHGALGRLMAKLGFNVNLAPVLDFVRSSIDFVYWTTIIRWSTSGRGRNHRRGLCQRSCHL